MEQGMGLLFIYFIFFAIIFNEMYKENKKLREDKEEPIELLREINNIYLEKTEHLKYE